MPGTTHCIFVADSRAHSFDKYAKPADFHFGIDFIIRRGAKVSDLVRPTLAKLRSYSQQDRLIIKVAVGINNLTKFIYDPTHRRRVLTRSSLDANSLLALLEDFRAQVVSTRPNSIVSFCTIPTASFAKFQLSRRLTAPILSEAELYTAQEDLDTVLDSVNSRIPALNVGSLSSFISITPHNLAWHSHIRRVSKRMSRSGKLRSSVRSNFSQLYDGLHATSSLKKRWFLDLYKSFARERQALLSLRS